MTIAKALGKKMLDNTVLSDLVDTEIHHGEQPIRKPKYIVYFLIPGLPVYANGSITSQRWQVSGRAKSSDDAYEIGQALVDQLDGTGEHITIDAGTDGTIDGGAADTGTFTSDYQGGDATTSTFLNIIEAGDDAFALNNISVLNFSSVKEPDSDYWHSPVDIMVAFKSTEND